MKLTPTELELPNYSWKAGKRFMKHLLEAYPPPKPAPTTVVTLLTSNRKKGGWYKFYGNSWEYYPSCKSRIVSQEK